MNPRMVPLRSRCRGWNQIRRRISVSPQVEEQADKIRRQVSRRRGRFRLVFGLWTLIERKVERI